MAWSNHLSSRRKRHRAMMVTDTAFYRYPYYQTAQDTPDKLNDHELAHAERAVSGLAGTGEQAALRTALSATVRRPGPG